MKGDDKRLTRSSSKDIEEPNSNLVARTIAVLKGSLGTIFDHILLIPIFARAIRKASNEAADAGEEVVQDWTDFWLNVEHQLAHVKTEHAGLRARAAFDQRLVEPEALVERYHQTISRAKVRYKTDQVAFEVVQALALKALKAELARRGIGMYLDERGKVQLLETQ